MKCIRSELKDESRSYFAPPTSATMRASTPFRNYIIMMIPLHPHTVRATLSGCHRSRHPPKRLLGAFFRIRSPPLATRVCPRAQGTHAAASGCPESLRCARLPPPGCGEERVTRLLQACVPLLLSARVTFAARVLLCRLGLSPMLPDLASISRHGCCCAGWGGHPCCPHPALEPTGVSGCCGHPSCPRPALGRSTYQPPR